MQGKKIKVLLVALVAIVFVAPALAQPPDTLWTKTFGGSGSDECYSVQQTTDLGYILGGNTSSFGTGFYLVKADATGNLQWQESYTSSITQICGSVQQTNDGGYIMGGVTSYYYGGGYYNMSLAKSDPAGVLIWQNAYGAAGGDWGTCARQTSDGGYILAGYTWSFGSHNQMYLVKTNSQGTLQWQTTLGGSATEDYAHWVEQTSDGGYILTGITSPYGSANDDYLLIKTDSQGYQTWQSTFGGGAYDRAEEVKPTPDGGYIVIGWTQSFGAGGADFYVVKTNSQGVMEWSQTYGGSGDDFGESICLTSDGGYILCGATNSSGAGLKDLYFVKTNALGDIEWDKCVGGSNDDYGLSVQQTADGGYIGGGYTTSFGSGASDMYLVRLAAEQPPPDVTITLVPFVYPLQIPASGGSFEFYVFVTNSGSDTAWVDLWTKAILPNGAVVGPLLGPASVALDSGVTGWVRSQNVPGRVPSGLYTYIACAGDYPGSIWASDSLQFTKLATGDGGGVGDWANWGAPLIGQADALDNHPATFVLHRPAPNPFNPATTIAYSLPEAAAVKLKVFDVSGRGVAALADGWQDAGQHSVVFDASGLPSGIYFARLSVNGFDQMQKLLLVK